MAANRIKGITIEIGGDTTKLDKALSGVNKSLRNTQSALKDVDKLLKLDPGNTTLLQQKQELLARAVSDTEEKLKTERDALEQLKKADPSPEVAEQMARLERQIVDDEQSLQKFKDAQKDFGSVSEQVLKAVGKKLQEVGKKVQEAGKAIKGVGDDLTKYVTGPLVAVGAAGVAAFKDVDEAMDTVITKTGATGEALEEMQGIVEDLATSMPTDLQTAADAVGEVSTRFGLTGDALEDLSESFIKFAALNDTDVSGSIDKVQAAMAAFGLSAEDAGMVLDVLTKANQDTGVSVDQLAASLTANGTALQEMGFNIEDAAGFLANLDKSGVDAGSTLTGLKKALQNATKEGKPLNEALEEMQKGMQGAKSDTEAAQKASELFGAKAGPAIAAAVRDGRLSFDDLANGVENFAGSVDATFAETLDPIDKWQMTLNEAKLALADVGAVILENVAPVAEKLRDVVEQLREKWDELGPGVQDAIIKGAMVAAVIGPIISGVGSLVIGIGGFITAVGTITGIVAPLLPVLGAFGAAFGGPVLAIGAAVAAFALFVTHAKDIENITNEVAAAVGAKWEELKNNLAAVGENIKATMGEKWNAIKTTVTTTFTNIKTTIINTAESIRSSVQQKFNAVKTAITQPIETAKKTVSDAIGKIKSTINNAKLSLPHFKLPHFNISGGKVPWGIGGQGVKPTISVSWYKKAYQNPVMFTQPTVLPTMGGLKGFGDAAGAEIVMSLEKLREVVGASGDQIVINVTAAPGMDVRQLAAEVERRLAQAQQRKAAVYA